MILQDIMNHHRETFRNACAGLAAVGLVVMGLVVAEQHYAHQALVNQEQVAWK